MSGEASGLILLPFAMAALPLVLGGLAVAGVAVATAKAGSAAMKYEQERRQRRDEIRRSDAAQSIGSFREEMQREMNRQTALNAQASEQMMAQLDRQRREMRAAAEQQDTQAFQSYVSEMKASRTATLEAITTAQNDFNASYRRDISSSMARISQNLNAQYADYMQQITQMSADNAARQEQAKEIAASYIAEARTLVTSLEEDYRGAKFAPGALATLQAELAQSESLFAAGRFEAAIASAKDTAMSALEEIYEADAKQQEWDNQYKLALVLSEEVRTYIESQAVVTQQVKEYAEKASGKTLDDDIVGVKISEYTDRNAQGVTRFDYLLARATQIYDDLRGASAEQYTTQQLRDCVTFLNDELYPAAASCVSGAVVNMNNAFSRQNLSEEIIDFFEEHNFVFNGYAYDDNCHDKALHIDLENEITGEELVITLAPELVSGGDVQTHVDLKQLRGDEANEQRKAYYRQCVEDVVRGGHPGAEVSLQCNAATKGRLSADTEVKRRIQENTQNN